MVKYRTAAEIATNSVFQTNKISLFGPVEQQQVSHRHDFNSFCEKWSFELIVSRIASAISAILFAI